MHGIVGKESKPLLYIHWIWYVECVSSLSLSKETLVQQSATYLRPNAIQFPGEPGQG